MGGGGYIIFELQKLKGHIKNKPTFLEVRKFWASFLEKKGHFLTMEKKL